MCFCNGQVVSLSPVEQGILSICLGNKMVGVHDSSDTYLLGDEPWIDVVGYKALHDGIDVHLVMEEDMTGQDHYLLFSKWVLVCNPSEVTGITPYIFCSRWGTSTWVSQ